MRLALAAALLCLRAPVGAMEVSLEENRAQRGSLGYVDIQRVFRLYPETQRAKQNFAEILRQSERKLAEKKSELISLRAELAKLNMERDMLLKTPIQIDAPPPPDEEAPAPRAPKQPVVIDIPGVTPAPIVVQPGSAQHSSATAKQPLVINIPGVTPSPIVVQPPPPAPGSSAKSATAAAAKAASRRDERLKELESAIADKISEIARKESAYKETQAQAEKSLLELENRRSEMLLGRIYEVMREVARDNSVSVVVDKTQILFGQNTVDLTEKVLKKLEERKP